MYGHCKVVKIATVPIWGRQLAWPLLGRLGMVLGGEKLSHSKQLAQSSTNRLLNDLFNMPTVLTWGWLLDQPVL